MLSDNGSRVHVLREIEPHKTLHLTAPMKNVLLPALLFTVGAQLVLVSSARATSTLADWTFEQYSTSGVNANPGPATGSGTSAAIGMTLDGSSENSGISTQTGSDGTNNSSSNKEWKVRGGSGGGDGNGWDSAEAIASQGAQFSVSTVGDTSIVATFDWYPSTNGEANLLVQYTTDGSNYVDLPSADITIPNVATLTVATNTTSSKTVLGSYLDATAGNTWYNGITLNFSSIAGTANDPNFAIRLVNASTGSDVVTAQAAGAFDNTKGNWSFDDVSVVGVAPEPSTWALLGLGLGGLLFFASNRAGRIFNS
jgi:hypothetical protein